MDAALNSDKLDRAEKLNRWMQTKGLTFRSIAQQYGCHWTFPGKVLRAETDEMPRKFRTFMLHVVGCPEDLLPPPGDKKQGTTRNQKRYQEFLETRRTRAIDSIRAQREGRVKSDISITAGL